MNSGNKVYIVDFYELFKKDGSKQDFFRFNMTVSRITKNVPLKVMVFLVVHNNSTNLLSRHAHKWRHVFESPNVVQPSYSHEYYSMKP